MRSVTRKSLLWTFVIAACALVSILFVYPHQPIPSRAKTDLQDGTDGDLAKMPSMRIIDSRIPGDNEDRSMGVADIVGRVVDRDRHPVAGAVVSIRGRTRVAETDDSGTFAIMEVESGSYMIHVEAGQLVGESVVDVKRDGGNEIVVISVAPGVLLNVVVIDAVTGAGVGGAEIGSVGVYARTLQNGHAVVGPVMSGSAYLQVEAAGYEQITFYCNQAPGAEYTQTLKAYRGDPLRGSIFDYEGKPIWDAEVVVFHEDGQRTVGRTRSNADGSWQIGAVSNGRVRVSAIVDSFVVAREITSLDGPSTRNMILRQERKLDVQGLIVDSRGGPVADAVVHGPPDSTTSDRAGRFTIQWTTAGRRTIWATLGGRASSIAVVDQPAPAVIRLVLYETLISGLVSRPDNSPLEHAVVVLDSDGGLPSVRGTSDATGRFSFAGIPLGEYTVSAQDDRWLPNLRGIGIARIDERQSSIEIQLATKAIVQQ